MRVSGLRSRLVGLVGLDWLDWLVGLGFWLLGAGEELKNVTFARVGFMPTVATSCKRSPVVAMAVFLWEQELSDLQIA